VKRQRVSGILRIPVPAARLSKQQAAPSSAVASRRQLQSSLALQPYRHSARLREVDERRSSERSVSLRRPHRSIPRGAILDRSPPRRSGLSRIGADRNAPSRASADRVAPSRRAVPAMGAPGGKAASVLSLARPTSQPQEDGIVRVLFRQGKLGIEYNPQTGLVNEVSDGQANIAGVKAGWRMLKLDGLKWSEALFRSRLGRPAPFEVIFLNPSKNKSSAPLARAPPSSKSGAKGSGRSRTPRGGHALLQATPRGGGPEPLQARPQGSARFPKTKWAEPMVDVLAEELQEMLQEGRGLARRAVQLGTDCSGAEAPVFALKEIARALASQLGVRLETDHRFACDVDFAPRNFIRKNCEPRALFADLLARTQIAHCLLEERPRMVPGNLDIYVAGFPCKDFSLLNKNRPGMEGPHVKVFYGVVDYIKKYQPRAFILENVQGLMMSNKGGAAPIAFVIKILRSIPGYQVHYWKVDTRNFYLPQHRVRVYIVGVHTKRARLRRPLRDWDELLEALQSPPKYEAHSYMLQDSEPEVRSLHRDLSRRSQFCFRRSTWRTVSAQARALKRHHGSRGFRWISKHVRLRNKYGMGDDQPLTGNLLGWTSFLSTRMRDVLEITAKKVESAIRRPAVESTYIAEISRGVAYTSTMDACTPCLTPTCVTWMFSRWRWLIGLEKLALQGFPVDDLNLDGFKESELQMLAGNAMSVPVVGALLLLVLALVEFPECPN